MQSRVVGGIPVRIEQYPYVVIFYNNPGACSGAIIGSRTILTAAHCFSENHNASLMYVYVGSEYAFSSDSVKHRVLDYALHPQYVNGNSSQPRNDIALLFLQNNIKFGPKAKKAILVNTDKWMNTKYNNFEMVGHGKDALEGTLPYDGMKRTTAAYVTHDDCAKKEFNGTDVKMSQDLVCFKSFAGTTTVCNGDSGSSILWKGMIVGVASYYRGLQCDPSAFEVYCNVWIMRDWIKNTWLEFRKKHRCTS